MKLVSLGVQEKRGCTHDLPVLLIKDDRGPAGNYPLISTPLLCALARSASLGRHSPEHGTISTETTIFILSRNLKRKITSFSYKKKKLLKDNPLKIASI